MKPIINAHCHLLNFRFVPDRFFNKRSPFRESILNKITSQLMVRMLTLLSPGRCYDRAHQVLGLLRLGIGDVAAALVKEMDAAGIQLATPLAMDLEFGCQNETPEIPYRDQLKMLSAIAMEFPERLFPFVMVDPRRLDSVEIAIQCLERMGFLGVKIYPSLGYSPDPHDVVNGTRASQNLEALYCYCERHSVPITAHCSRGGAYAEEIVPEHRVRAAYAHPRSWKPVLREHSKLILNLAHFGGDFGQETDDSWSQTILDMMKQHPTLYADLSYHPQALERKARTRYFSRLRNVLDDPNTRNRVLFGTDWFMLRHTWTETQIVNAFRQLPPDDFSQITFENPSAFLFPTDISSRLAPAGAWAMPNRANAYSVDDNASSGLSVTKSRQANAVHGQG